MKTFVVITGLAIFLLTALYLLRGPPHRNATRVSPPTPELSAVESRPRGKKVKATDDPHAKSSGAKTKEEQIGDDIPR
jgi:hypothetical protein